MPRPKPPAKLVQRGRPIRSSSPHDEAPAGTRSFRRLTQSAQEQQKLETAESGLQDGGRVEAGTALWDSKVQLQGLRLGGYRFRRPGIGPATPPGLGESVR